MYRTPIQNRIWKGTNENMRMWRKILLAMIMWKE